MRTILSTLGALVVVAGTVAPMTSAHALQPIIANSDATLPDIGPATPGPTNPNGPS